LITINPIFSIFRIDDFLNPEDFNGFIFVSKSWRAELSLEQKVFQMKSTLRNNSNNL